MASYIVNADGTLLSVPANSALPEGSRWAEADEVEQWEQANLVRSAAGIPAPKTPQQAQLEYEQLQENIAKRGGLATPQERANLATLQEQMGQPGTLPETTPTVPAEGLPVVVGRGANAGDQYTQYEPVGGSGKVVVEEPVAEPQRDVKLVEPAPSSPPRSAPADSASSGKPPLPEGKRDLPNSSPEERAKNSPTAKDKEK